MFVLQCLSSKKFSIIDYLCTRRPWTSQHNAKRTYSLVNLGNNPGRGGGGRAASQGMFFGIFVLNRVSIWGVIQTDSTSPLKDIGYRDPPSPPRGHELRKASRWPNNRAEIDETKRRPRWISELRLGSRFRIHATMQETESRIRNSNVSADSRSALFSKYANSLNL